MNDAHSSDLRKSQYRLSRAQPVFQFLPLLIINSKEISKYFYTFGKVPIRNEIRFLFLVEIM